MMSQLASVGQLRMSFLRVALVTVPLVLFFGVLSGALANSSAGNVWYASLRQPSIMPPSWVFGVVWTTLYILIGLALSLVIFARGASGRRIAIGLFVAQFVLNLAWAPTFFAAHRIGLAFAIILLMIVLTLATTLAFARIRSRAALLMLPYLAWLCFAAWLNHSIELLNPAAGNLAPAPGSAQVEL